jgi:hypothetical protein
MQNDEDRKRNEPAAHRSCPMCMTENTTNAPVQEARVPKVGGHPRKSVPGYIRVKVPKTQHQ